MLALIDAHVKRGNALLAQIDEHLERGGASQTPEHRAQGARLAARLEDYVARSKKVIAAGGEMFDDPRLANRRDSLRNERSLGEMSDAMDRLTESFDRRTAEIVAEARAQRDALWAILDRLQNEGEGARRPDE